MDKTKVVFSLDRIRKNFGGLLALDNVSLDLESRKIVGILGPNGAGKSTLFNVITSIVKPDAGDVYLKGKRITGRSPHAICRMGISRTFQLVRSFLSMTALENVLVGSVYGSKLRGKAALNNSLEALELVDLIHKKDMTTAHMTLSDRRLLEVARALASHPQVTLLDEPMAGLNPSEIITMLGVINKAREERDVAILWVEHKVDAIFHLCDRIVVLEYGRKIAEGNPEEIAKNKIVIEAYLGETPA
ncbi:MAG: ABC transporter ATP-binding protein [Deltaproteobacteria bacterium]|nr:ABC transporter ATP-binding protein [Deltaproteobacteria bacterium]